MAVLSFCQASSAEELNDNGAIPFESPCSSLDTQFGVWGQGRKLPFTSFASGTLEVRERNTNRPTIRAIARKRTETIIFIKKSVATVLFIDVVIHLNMRLVHITQNAVYRTDYGPHDLVQQIRILIDERFKIFTRQYDSVTITYGA